MSIASPTKEPAFATTSDVAEAAQLHKETLLKLRRLGPEGPFELGRDYVTRVVAAADSGGTRARR